MEQLLQFLSLKKPQNDLVISEWYNNDKSEGKINSQDKESTDDYDPNNVNIDNVWIGKKFFI